ncbi:transglycosylase SLT domain-containing protein [Candidatus Dojkabacteria bacterium]|jgi:hypothetical protein|nr:transglycosylase SLT domain-containing protein [Candidatus Dojkabacteria bacterium]
MWKILITFIVVLLLVSLIPTKLHYQAVEASSMPLEQAKLPPIKEYAQSAVIDTFGGHWNEFNDLINRESKWNHLAQNPNSSAFGLGQFLNSTWKSVDCVKTKDPYKQIDCTIAYIQDRYDTPSKALKFHKANGYY